jgi:ligand-binding sensor domain-containing protein
VGAIVAAEGSVWVGVLPGGGKRADTPDLLWSRFDKASETWQSEAEPPPDWEGREKGWTMERDPLARDADGTLWQVVQVARPELPIDERYRNEVRHVAADGTTVLAVVPLEPVVEFGMHRCLALTADAVWLSSRAGLYRIDRRSLQVENRLDASNGLVGGNITVLTADAPHLWIGTERYGANRLDLDSGRIDYFAD